MAARLASHIALAAEPHTADWLPRVGNGVTLRRLAVADLAAFQAYRHDVEVGRYQGWLPVTDAEASAFLAEMHTAALLKPGVWCQIGMAEADGLALIGDIGLLLAADGRQVEIGFSLRRKSQGHGLATAAVRAALQLVFEHSAAVRVVGITDARNAASIRLLERVGMQRVATAETVFRGEQCVELTYAVARSVNGDALQSDLDSSIHRG